MYSDVVDDPIPAAEAPLSDAKGNRNKRWEPQEGASVILDKVRLQFPRSFFEMKVSFFCKKMRIYSRLDSVVGEAILRYILIVTCLIENVRGIRM